MAQDMRGLGAVLVGPRSGSRVDGAVLGEVLWAALRGLALSQMLARRPVDSRAEREVLVDLLASFIGGGRRPAHRPGR
jgi:hypothetical protein